MKVPLKRFRNYRRPGVGRAVQRALLGAAAVVFLGAVAARAADKQPKPATIIPLEALGYPGASQNLLSVGASVLTVNFLDDSHLLVTYGERGLVPRVAGDPPEHDDRMVAAEVVELPSGKVLAKTEWHMHDHARYLWSLGQGRFLVRIGGTFATMAPLARLGSSDPFTRVAFRYRGLLPSVVLASPDARILTIEAKQPLPKNKVASWADAQEDPTETVIDLFRMDGAGSDASPLAFKDYQAVVAPHPLVMPIDNDGYLWLREDERDPSQWGMVFNGFDGKTMELGSVQSSCGPRLQLVSKSEFLVMTCSGSDDKVKLAAYGFDAHETWEEPFSATSGLTFAYAPVAGRFAMSRLFTSSADPGAQLPVGETTHQELRVYQTESGDLLLKLACSPTFRTEENFDLSPDGMKVAVVKDATLQIYQLPEPSRQDRKDLAEVEKFAPVSAGDVAISLAKIAAPQPKAGEVLAGGVPHVASAVTSTQSETVAGDGPVAAAKPGERQTANGDAQTGRQKPTLLLPGEQAEFKDKKPKADSQQPQ